MTPILRFLPFALLASEVMAQDMLVDLNFWRPNGTVFCIELDSANNTAYIGGAFTSLTDPDPPFTSVARNHVAAIDITTGEPLPWDPNVDFEVLALAHSSAAVYIGGWFTSVGGQPRTGLAAVDKTSGTTLPWDPAPVGYVRDLFIVNGKLYVGGNFLSIAGAQRSHAAAFNLGTGALTNWNPAPSDVVIALQPIGNTMYLGGHFTMLSGGASPYIAGVDMSSGSSVSALPAPNAPVRTLTTAGGHLYFGGDFTQVGAQPRAHAAALNGSALTGWLPEPNNVVNALTTIGGQIGVGGDFTAIGGQPYYAKMALVDPLSGTATAWDPDVVGGVVALASSGGRLFAGGMISSSMQFPTPNLATFSAAPALVRVQPRVFLEGCYVSAQQNMNDALRAASLVPQTEPYSAMGYTFTAGGAQGTITSSVMASATNPVVDWVVVELRDPLDPAAIVASKRGVLLRSGYVMDVNKTSPLWIPAPPGNYHVAIKHRNHLGAMSAAPLALSATSSIVDFTAPNFVAYGTNAMRTIGSKQVLWAGDASRDGVVRYTGADNDRDQILQAIGGSVPTNVVSNVYDARDVNLDGAIMYVGANNDRDLILQTIGGTVPTATRTQQLP